MEGQIWKVVRRKDWVEDKWTGGCRRVGGRLDEWAVYLRWQNIPESES